MMYIPSLTNDFWCTLVTYTVVFHYDCTEGSLISQFASETVRSSEGNGLRWINSHSILPAASESADGSRVGAFQVGSATPSVKLESE